MKLPNAENVIILEAKITRYLLAPDHPTGQGKADFFLAHGFTAAEWEHLAWALRTHAATYAVAVAKPRPYGVNYVVEGPLATPNGRRPWVRSVWMIENGAATARLLTAYPCRRR